MTGTAPIGRRAFLWGAVGLAPAAMAGAAQDTAVAPLWQPGAVGRPRGPVTNYENDPFIIAVERRLRCTCGCNLDIYTCRTTDFTCTYSPELHREVIRLVEQDKSGEEIIAAFVAKYGETALMAPPKEGFNWAGYLLPGILITLVGAVLVWVLARRARRPAAVAAAEEANVPGLSPDDRARLRAALDRLES